MHSVVEIRKGHHTARHEDHLLGALPLRACPATPHPTGVRCNIEPEHRASLEGIRTAYAERRDVTKSLAYQGSIVGSPPQAASPSNRRVFYDTAATQGPPLYLRVAPASQTGSASPHGGGRESGRRFSSKKNASSIFS